MSAWLDALLALHFLRPWWLLALLLLPVLVWQQRRQRRARSDWQDAVDPHLLPHLLEPAGHGPRGAWIGVLIQMGLLLVILALAGPSFRKDMLPAWQSREPLVVALDLSRATLARDLPPSRLLQARAKLERLLQARVGGQVALLVFAEDAYTVAPLTADPGNVALFLDALSPSVMPADGARADRAIVRASELLQQAGFAAGEILLMTDHADAAAMASATKARTEGFRVSVLGLGTTQGGVYEGESGLRQTRLDAASLRALAARGGGRYQAMTTDDVDLRTLGVLDPHSEAGAAGKPGTVARWRDEGYWLLPLALLCLLPLFRRGGTLVLLVCLLWQPLLPARAQQAATQQSELLPQGTLWQRADQMAHAQMQAGIAAYRRKDYAQAITEFKPLAGAEGQYNLGNALAQAGRYDEAIAAYDRALRQQPGMGDAVYNKALVEAARKQQTQQQPQNQQQQSDQGQGQAQDQAQGQQRRQQGQAKPNARKSQQEQVSQTGAQEKAQQNPPQTDKPQDAQRQAQADAAQKQQMQEALRKRQAKAAAPKASGKPQETSAERERRLANEAWLQRVPDDPGALLRARFQLEARRRQEAQP